MPEWINDRLYWTEGEVDELMGVLTHVATCRDSPLDCERCQECAPWVNKAIREASNE